MFPIFFVNGFIVGASTTYIFTRSYVEYKYYLVPKDIPKNLMNASPILNKFKEGNIIDYLWNALLDSITSTTPETFCPPLLKQFLEEPSKGLQEAYASQYAEKISNLPENQAH
jgi:hypothetical protein